MIKHTEDFKREAVRIALTSGLSRRRVAADLGVGLSTLGKWVSQYRPTNLVTAPQADRQYARLVDEWVGAVGLNVSEFGTHSIRRTKASHIYKTTGSLRAIQILLGHSNIENTLRYLASTLTTRLPLQSAVSFERNGSSQRRGFSSATPVDCHVSGIRR